MSSVNELFAYYDSYLTAHADSDTVITAAAVYAHPDDEIIHSNLITAANACGIKLVGMTLSGGEASTVNYRAQDPTFNIAEGGRFDEAFDGQRQVGFADHVPFDGTDGYLEQDVPWLVQDVADALVAHDVHIVFGISQMRSSDSTDHESARRIAYEAAGKAARDLGHVGLLTIQPDGSGDWHAESSAQSLEVVSMIALANRSQYRIGKTEDRPSDWHEVSPGYAMHPEDWSQLDGLYPISGTATYTYAQCGRLLVPELVKVT